mmetsp:Transcript_8653/g.17730  ORF Transcript_8653/g.17730 Transcript_8653/m.17730 type:complete len:221 (-) Transcript_8653:732-1394(-)
MMPTPSTSSPGSSNASSLSPSSTDSTTGNDGQVGTTTVQGPNLDGFQFEFSPPPPARPEQPSTNNSGASPASRLENLTWSDIQTDEHGEPTSCLGIPFAALTAKQLRTLCSRLEVRGVKNARKDVMVLERIVAQFKNRATFAALESTTRTQTAGDVPSTIAPRREIQCPFRLMNILFSDMFAERFANTGNVASRHLLDTGLAGNDQHFWEAVRQAFVSCL